MYFEIGTGPQRFYGIGVSTDRLVLPQYKTMQHLVLLPEQQRHSAAVAASSGLNPAIVRNTLFMFVQRGYMTRTTGAGAVSGSRSQYLYAMTGNGTALFESTQREVQDAAARLWDIPLSLFPAAELSELRKLPVATLRAFADLAATRRPFLRTEVLRIDVPSKKVVSNALSADFGWQDQPFADEIGPFLESVESSESRNRGTALRFTEDGQRALATWVHYLNETLTPEAFVRYVETQNSEARLGREFRERVWAESERLDGQALLESPYGDRVREEQPTWVRQSHSAHIMRLLADMPTARVIPFPDQGR